MHFYIFYDFYHSKIVLALMEKVFYKLALLFCLLMIYLYLKKHQYSFQDHYFEFESNHLEFVEKGNKSAEGRARKAIGEIKKLVTEYRKESVKACKSNQYK